jgi:hypothetical protein
VVLHVFGDGPSRTDTLHTARAPKSATYGRHRIELLDVQPYPRTTERDRVPAALMIITTAP